MGRSESVPSPPEDHGQRDREARPTDRNTCVARPCRADTSFTALLKSLGLRRSFRLRQTVYLPGDVPDIRGLKREAEVRAAMGLRSRFIGPEELLALTTIVGRGAILSGGSGN